MTQLVTVPADRVPALVTAAGDRAAYRFLEFFTAQIRNPNTRRAYARAVGAFLTWLETQAVASIAAVSSLHVAAYVEQLTRSEQSAPTVKQQLAAIRRLFDWLAAGGVLLFNPASAVRGPSHSAKTGATPVLDPQEARQLLDAIDITVPIGLRDRALIALTVYSFARIGAAVTMKVEDVFTQNRRLWVRLHDKGGKRHEMPCHHNLEEYLHAYIDGCGLAANARELLFTTIGRGTGRLTRVPLSQPDAHALIRRRAKAAGIEIGNHTFRATDITAYRKNGGTLEKGSGDGEPLFYSHDAAIRSSTRRGEPFGG